MLAFPSPTLSATASGAWTAEAVATMVSLCSPAPTGERRPMSRWSTGPPDRQVAISTLPSADGACVYMVALDDGDFVQMELTTPEFEAACSRAADLLNTAPNPPDDPPSVTSCL